MRADIAFFNRAGGVGSTLLAGHLCNSALEFDLRVAGASLGGPPDLRRWLSQVKIPWYDARHHTIPRDFDLVVWDVNSQTHYEEVVSPNLWLLPVDRPRADQCAVELAETLRSGKVLRVRNGGLPELELSLELESTNVGIPRCTWLAASECSGRAVWSTEAGARSAGARAVRELAVELFCRVGLLAPTPAWDPREFPREDLPEVPEADVLERLKGYFANRMHNGR